MSVPLSIAEAVALETRGARKIAPLWRVAEATASLVARPAMVRNGVLAAGAPSRPPGFQMAAVAAATAFAGSAVGLAFFLSRKPTGALGDSHAKFRA